MKNLILLLLTGCFVITTYSQARWQQQTDYTIDVSLNDRDKTLDGFETVVYTNNSPDTLHFIWFHLWPNAYKNDRTAFSDQLLENGNTAFYFSDKAQRGYINRLDFKVDGNSAKIEDHPQHIDIIKVVLTKPLAPKAKAIITTPFHVKLPFNFSRGGYDGESFQVTQWYPKPAVYDQKGWHPMAYLDQGEFYSEFGNFDVRITLPKDYVVAATGELQNANEKEWLKTRTNYAAPETPKKSKSPVQRKIVPKSKAPVVVATQETKTLHFKQSNVHDFAWFANKYFIVNSDTLQVAGRTINVSSFYTPAEKSSWQSSVQMAKDAVRFYSSEVGEYPYNAATVVQGPTSFGGGMEYPTITVIAPASSAQSLDETIAHELGHNWFYGILASNERQFLWMDEGMTTFYTEKYTERKYGKQSSEEELFFQLKAANKKDQPIKTLSEELSVLNYGLSAYHKTSEWMKLLEQRLGKDAFRQMMQEYY
ncbi:MAG: M1 family peptidase, partial [Chitinophagaceae bacterium]